MMRFLEVFKSDIKIFTIALMSFRFGFVFHYFWPCSIWDIFYMTN